MTSTPLNSSRATQIWIALLVALARLSFLAMRRSLGKAMQMKAETSSGAHFIRNGASDDPQRPQWNLGGDTGVMFVIPAGGPGFDSKKCIGQAKTAPTLAFLEHDRFRRSRANSLVEKRVKECA